MYLSSYTINKKTLAIVPISDNKTKIYESNNVIVVAEPVKKLIEDNCRYYGSSYDGRKKGTSDLIGVTHKSPIVIEDSTGIIFFPTCSPRLKNCSWISLNNIDTYKKYNTESMITFQNNLTLKIPVSSKIINNQILRATRLEVVYQKRKNKYTTKNDKIEEKSF